MGRNRFTSADKSSKTIKKKCLQCLPEQYSIGDKNVSNGNGRPRIERFELIALYSCARFVVGVDN